MNEYAAKIKAVTKDYPPQVVAASAFVAGIATIGISHRIYRTQFRRIRNSDWVTPDILERKKWIRGVVTSVGDADNFRLYHTPGFGWRWPLKFRRIPTTTKELKDQTIHIRMAGVDAPEGAHFGREAQPYAAECLAWLRSRILGKRVYCRLVRRDQYSRIVAIVTETPWILPGTFFTGKDLSLTMLQAGWATTYEQSGAEYGVRGKDVYLAAEAAAKAKRLGIWATGIQGETPAEYKRRHASLDAAKAPTVASKSATPREAPAKKSWFAR